MEGFISTIKGHRRRLLVTLVGLGMATSVSAQQNNEVNVNRPQVASLVASPGRCVLKSGNSICQMTMSLIWEAPNVDSYCIWHEKQAHPIKCWDEVWQGSVRLKFKSSQKTSFVLKVKGDDAQIAAANVAVTGSYKQRKRAQRRKRGFWRMF